MTPANTVWVLGRVPRTKGEFWLVAYEKGQEPWPERKRFLSPVFDAQTVLPIASVAVGR